ncbi:hypothetical protein BMG00_13070 [Thioclava marina]|uniref:Gfo/Idh/MocA family oxidoreductase n=1 Tax=Thioclava marina TaxID=1915077 RepID=A0ABX3MKA5_9RHOB|nr:Gfo/Idh/MocA family oxidoreductase [Thioclava marina]OOY11997.1 hypothetical protein BMG00_13070 [Thioclava marina]
MLVAGLGSIGRRHLRLVRARLPEAQIMVLRHSGCSESVVGADFCTTELEEALDFAPQVAVIATPAPYHAAPAIALVRAGTHILVEKPMAASAADARALAAEAQATGVVLQVGYNLRFLESLATFRAAVLGGEIGRVGSVRAEVGQYLPDWRPGTDFRAGVSARSELGGGALLELSHEIDYLRWIFGEVTRLRGWLGQQGGLGIDVEDTVHMLLEFASPLPDRSDGAAPVAVVTLDFIRRDTLRRCTAIGETGTLTWDGVSSQLRLARPGAAEVLLFDRKPERDATYVAQLDAFLASIATGSPVVVPGTDGAAVMEIVEAVRHSHATDGRAQVPEIKAQVRP